MQEILAALFKMQESVGFLVDQLDKIERIADANEYQIQDMERNLRAAINDISDTVGGAITEILEK